MTWRRFQVRLSWLRSVTEAHSNRYLFPNQTYCRQRFGMRHAQSGSQCPMSNKMPTKLFTVAQVAKTVVRCEELG